MPPSALPEVPTAFRLLKRDSDGSIRRVEYSFSRDVIPPYAIVSSTRSYDNEVVYGDFDNNGLHIRTALDKKEWKKLRFCSEQAARDGLEYIWMDSCCVNALDGSEVARATMLVASWYQYAEKCYVVLDDVSGTLWETDFERSRWFTRCWHLQDLLLPKSVQFFARSRMWLGDRVSLAPLIQRITGIPMSALKGHPLQQFTIDEKLRWNENREADKEEDKWYSLMGIFGVVIWPLYGEGEENAKTRLMQEIKNKTPETQQASGLQRPNPMLDAQPAAPSYQWAVDMMRPRSTTDGRETPSPLKRVQEVGKPGLSGKPQPRLVGSPWAEGMMALPSTLGHQNQQQPSNNQSYNSEPVDSGMPLDHATPASAYSSQEHRSQTDRRVYTEYGSSQARYKPQMRYNNMQRYARLFMNKPSTSPDEKHQQTISGVTATKGGHAFAGNVYGNVYHGGSFHQSIPTAETALRETSLRETSRHENYTVGWVSALPVELTAAQEMLDQEHDDLPIRGDDDNIYTLGRIGEHNVVLACLPAGQTGTNSAATVANQMKTTFRSIRFGLMVGIGGGVPSEEADIRLGDIIVSQPGPGHGGVVQYDFGKSTPSGFERTGLLNMPPRLVLGAVSKMRANHDRGRRKFPEYIAKLGKLPTFDRANAGGDVLFHAEYNHGSGGTCQGCDRARSIKRDDRSDQDPVVHYGTIASGNQVMRSGAMRDQISSELGGILCFEMEASGLMNSFPCLVVRGVCDYADDHKNKKWQPYAAGAAAAYAKELLLLIPPSEVANTQTADEATRS